jgi:hypothetical protein
MHNKPRCPMVLGNSMGFKELLAHQLLFIENFVRTSMQSFEILENILKLAFKVNVLFAKHVKGFLGIKVY